MLKNKQFWIGFLVALVVFVGLGELQRSNNRANAIDDLNSNYSKATTATAKNALVIKTDAIIGENQSWFGFSNSSAWSPSRGGEEKTDESNNGTGISGSAGSSTRWMWFNSETNRWQVGGEN